MQVIAILFLLLSASVYSKETISLTLASQIDGGHAFYHELLYEALAAQGYDVEISILDEHTPQKRAIKMVSSGALTLTWLLPTSERDAKFVSVGVPITNGLIGKRIMLIPPELQAKLSKINSLDELRASGLIGGMGINWFDVAVWERNDLAVYREDGEWRTLYQKLTVDGDVNYFPRGLNEVMNEAELNPHLAIENHLLLQYERDFYFYISPKYANLQPLLYDALVKARENGMIERLVQKHWGGALEEVNESQRIVIELSLPSQPSQKQ